MVEILGSVFHYAVVTPYADHALCDAQVAGIIAYHENHGYKQGGAYNGHFCQHGEKWISYLGWNQATGDTWANLNLHAWCWLGGPDSTPSPAALQAAYDLTVVEPTGRDQIYCHLDFVPTSCCGPLCPWVKAGALAPEPVPPAPKEYVVANYVFRTDPGGAIWKHTGGRVVNIQQAEMDALLAAGVKQVPDWSVAEYEAEVAALAGAGTSAAGNPVSYTITGTAVPQ